MGRCREMGRTERGWAAGEGNGPSEVGRRPGAVLGLGKKGGRAGLETGKEERERLRVLLFFLLKPFFETFSNFKFKHFFNFSNFKTFQSFTPTNKNTMHSNYDARALIASKLLK
jgi:hypothetical protein